MRFLVGIPAFRLPHSLRRCLESILENPVDVLVVDNGADGNVKALLKNEFRDRISVVSLPFNTYCNGGWNQIMKYGLDHMYDTITLGTSDVFLGKGWYSSVCQRLRNHSQEVLVPSLGDTIENPDTEDVRVVHEGLPGYFTFMPREAVQMVYPIPHTLRHWFGDQYMYEKLRAAGWKTTIMNQVKATHEWSSVTAVTPEAYKVIDEDKLAWEELNKQR